MTNVNDIIDYENGEMEFDRMVEFFQGMILLFNQYIKPYNQ